MYRSALVKEAIKPVKVDGFQSASSNSLICSTDAVVFASSVAILVKFIGSFMLQLLNRSDQ